MTRYKTKQNANALREWMWLKAYTAKDVADALGICQSTVHKLRRGALAPTIEAAICLHEMSGGYVNVWNWQDLNYRMKMKHRYQKVFNKNELSEELKAKKRKKNGLVKPKSLSRKFEDIRA